VFRRWHRNFRQQQMLSAAARPSATPALPSTKPPYLPLLPRFSSLPLLPGFASLPLLPGLALLPLLPGFSLLPLLARFSPLRFPSFVFFAWSPAGVVFSLSRAFWAAIVWRDCEEELLADSAVELANSVVKRSVSADSLVRFVFASENALLCLLERLTGKRSKAARFAKLGSGKEFP
jgi:hypothetical protein